MKLLKWSTAIILAVVIGIYLDKQPKPDIEFNKSQWLQNIDFSFNHRNQMIQDLMTNRLNKGMSYDSVISLLGEQTNIRTIKKNTIHYTIYSEYNLTEDELVGEHKLVIYFTPDSVVSNFKITRWQK
ncbi:outer membrane protein assembly factor BamE [Prolixibacteraceae bacterium]|nr:outer membrane protein assembly factor BamE [Prolixibacteraceae bacterium]